MSLVTIECPTGCEGWLPAVDFDHCDPAVDFGEISQIYVTGQGNFLSDWTDAAEWATRLDDTTEDNDTLIRTLIVKGDQPPAESTEYEISNCRVYWGEKKFTINFDIDETNITNHDFMRQIECGGLFTIWYAAGDYMYGGTRGIDVTISLNQNITRGCNEMNLLTGTVKWQAKHHPEKIANPLL
jgi:hypothetical protein